VDAAALATVASLSCDRMMLVAHRVATKNDWEISRTARLESQPAIFIFLFIRRSTIAPLSTRALVDDEQAHARTIPLAVAAIKQTTCW